LTSQKPKRSRFSQKHRSDGVRLADVLRQYQKDFPRFTGQINECIERIMSDAERTRASDREKVLIALREWEYGLTAKELVEDTALSHWDVRQVLKDLLKKGAAIEHRELRNGGHSKQWCITYRLKSQANGFLS
jgi:hypothetical protein